MIINLGYGWAVAGKYFLAFFICLKDRFICFRLVFFQPGKERGAKVVADFRIGINNVYNLSVAIEDAGSCIWGVTLCSYFCIPIVVRIGGILQLNLLQPGVFAGRLIEMPVNAYITVLVYGRISFLKITIAKGGSVKEKENSFPCIGRHSASTPPKFPWPLPPYSSASLFINSFQNPPEGTPIL